ncbi:hypothetical protein BU17DRAFT_89180 [Hysterangium stoloniferum]|nr:hypothetical protein BU17DRAFT_89180 [Hysterangium stoloniferum]
MSPSFSQDNSIFLQDHNKSPGILLNNVNTSIPAPYLDPPALRHRQLSSSQASSSSSTSNSRSRSPRRIRFAPLPEPRRVDDSQVPNSPFYDSDSDAPSPCPPTPPDYPPSPRFGMSALSPEDPPPKPKSKSWGQKFLAPLFSPLKQSNADPHSPTSSHDSYTESKYKSGAPLERSTSAGSRTITPLKEPLRDGGPLTRVASESARLSGPNTTRGTRMLNGRVYGRRHHSSDISNTAPNNEPEFVEWGYGGMGSVNAEHKGTPGTDWAKLQRQGKILGDDDPDGDDGSGMGWVKKRREQREREKKAQQEKEQSDAVPEIAVHPPTEGSRKDSSQKTERDNNTAPEHHVYQAVSVPASSPHPHHLRRRDSHQAHARATDGNATPTALSRTSSDNATILSRTSSSNTATLSRNNATAQPALYPPSRDDAETSSGSSFTSTSTSSVDGDDDEEEDTEKDSDEESDEETHGRITSRCAQVEKVSRHTATKE